jgi:hypothetical protein
MKKIITIVASIIICGSLIAQKANWQEMHNFHKVMGKTFHSAEENNLQPLKDSATALVLKAKAWQQSKTPSGYNETVTKPILKKLVAKCNQVQKAVAAKKDDKTLVKLITEAHDIFHEIMEKCRVDDKHKH